MATVPVTEEIKLRRVALTSLMGTAMEWYDYFIYGLFAALIFDQLFFLILILQSGLHCHS